MTEELVGIPSDLEQGNNMFRYAFSKEGQDWASNQSSRGGDQEDGGIITI